MAQDPNQPYAFRNNKTYFGTGMMGQQNQFTPYGGFGQGNTGNPYTFNAFNNLDINNNLSMQWHQPFRPQHFASNPFAPQPSAAQSNSSLPHFNARLGDQFNHFLARNLQTKPVTPDNEAAPVAPTEPPVVQSSTIESAEQPLSSHTSQPPGDGNTIPIYTARVS